MLLTIAVMTSPPIKKPKKIIVNLKTKYSALPIQLDISTPFQSPLSAHLSARWAKVVLRMQTPMEPT